MVELLPVTLAALLAGLTFVYLLLKHFAKNGCPSNLPRGNMGWPICGETISFLKSHRSNSLGTFLEEHCSRYGKVFKSHLFAVPTIVSCDHDLNIFVLQNEGKLFPVNYPKPMHHILGKFSLLLISGDLHKKLRNTIVSFISASKSDQLLHCIEKLTLSTLESWKDCKEVSFYKQAKRFSLSVMLKHLLNIDSEEPLASKILEEFETYIKGFVSLPIRIPGTTCYKAIKARERLQSIIKELLAERQKGNAKPAEGADCLNVILSKQNLSDEERVSVVMDLLFGGYETTAKLMSLIVYFLSQAPKALETLKEEHQAIRKGKEDGKPLNLEDYKQMEFTNSVIYEAMRLGNVVKFLHRIALEDVKFKDITIPSGWQVLPVLSSSHFDPTLHENPQEFNPWRWNDNATSKKVLPFGGGPRLCPGSDIAKVEISFFLHHLVLNYRWKTKPDDYPLAFPYVEFTRGLQLEIAPS